MVILRFPKTSLSIDVPCSASITALMGLKKAFESRKGLFPGTIATLNQVLCTGRINESHFAGQRLVVAESKH